MQTMTQVKNMNSRKLHPDAMDAFVLRSFVLSLVDSFQHNENAPTPWEDREEGIVMIEEILLEGRACGIESREGFEELCKSVFACRIRMPFSHQIRQILQRSGLTELQRIESLRLSLMCHQREAKLTNIQHASRN